MRHLGAKVGKFLLGAAVLSLASRAGPAGAQSRSRTPDIEEIRIVELQGKVEIMPAGTTRWFLATTNHTLRSFDRLRTWSNSRVSLLWSAQSVVPLGALTEIEVLPVQDRDALPGIHMMRGLLSFFHRDRPGRIRVITHGGANASIKGTEFALAVDSHNGQELATLSVIEGEVQFGNGQGQPLILTNLQQAVAEQGKAPIRTPGFDANNILQWCFYYPGVLDPDELGLSTAEEQALKESLTAYRAGDLLQALAKCPSPRQSDSDAEKVYYAALLLSVGQVEKTEDALAALSAGSQSGLNKRLALSLRTLIAAVKRQPDPSTLNPLPRQSGATAGQLSTELLAASYYAQSLGQGDRTLREALALARQAATNSARFGFAWERVAELEFSFGHTRASLEVLERSLQLAPSNAQALALKGFLLAAENRTRQAAEWFDRAIAVDAALGNAWLGRGLCRMRQGDSTGGVEDLMVAASMEPQRSLLRSYLGKAYTQVDDFDMASGELNLAIKLDKNDPTPWLYSALLKQQENRINEAIGDLETSESLHDNRSLFRSRLLLDEDLAVSSANLASIYQDAGMTDVSVREASRAVTYDYANASAHLFLSDSYNALRDPTRFNLRYETVWFNELLLANLLSPIGGGRLSQSISQQEYSRLFQADGLGLANSTLGRSDNKSVTELASQYGTFGWTSYAFDLDYQHNDGVRPNNGLDSIEWYTTVKQQITPQDTLLALVKYEDYHSGDNFQYYDPLNPTNGLRPNFQFTEYQQPIVVGGWHHDWAQGVHTLLLGGRVATEQYFSDTAVRQLVLGQVSGGSIEHAAFGPFDVNYHGQSEIYLAELNQIFQSDRITLSLGGRWQGGSFQTQAQFTNPPGPPPLFDPVSQASLDEGFNRLTGYGYLTVKALPRLWLIAGAAYDDITYPDNFRNPPLSPGEAHTYQLGPKAGLVWNPVPLFTLRGAYTRSLGGVSADESYRLEQTQVAGFPQAFRSLISESVVGSVSAPTYETYSAALDLKLPSRTYAGIQVNWLNTDVDRTVGAFVLSNNVTPFVPTSTLEQLRYRENSIGGSINQLLGKDFVVGANYRYDHVEFDDLYTLVPAAAWDRAPPLTDHTADLHEATGYVLFNHPSGFFARADATWYHQINSDASMPGDDFVQENIYVGYRFLHRHAELMFGILNLSGQDYHLNPLNTYMELPRERSYILRLNFVF